MPTTTTDNNTKAIVTLFQLAEKAWRGGGGFGASSGLGGHGGHGVSKPGSRGGHPWTDSRGNIRYGAQPKGGHSGKKPQAVVGHTNSARVAAHRAAVQHQKPMVSHGPALHPNSLAATRLRQTKMLEELMKVHRTGLDPHGNKLDPKQLAQVNSLITALRIQTHPQNNRGVGRTSTKVIAVEVTKEITEKAANRLPFTVFKDKAGQYRWVGVSSSAAQDADGETVSLKALQEDVARKDITRDYGNLNWWHTSIKIGTCDFNAMDGPLLVESGTFLTDQIAEHIGKAIKNGVFLPGVSLEFEHSEPGPPVLRGRVFKTINKKDRALLPADKASNLLTSFKVYSLKSAALADKEVKEMIPKEKLEELERILPPELLAGLLEGNQTAIKMAIAANHSFKELAPAAVVEPPVAAAVVETAPVAAVVETEPAPVVSPVAAAAVEPPVAVGEEAPLEVDTEAIFETLAQSVADKILAGQAATSATSSKEVSEAVGVMTVALKENTTALNQVVAENIALKARLDALEGLQPAQVRARASQQGGIPLDQLAEKDRELVDPSKKEIDPYERIVQQLGLIPVSQR